jgi:hypothetical protein
VPNCSLRFFFNGKYIINKKQVSAQDKQRFVKKGLQTKAPYISGTPMKILKHTPPNRGLFLIPYLEIHSSAIKPPEKHQLNP